MYSLDSLLVAGLSGAMVAGAPHNSPLTQRPGLMAPKVVPKEASAALKRFKFDVILRALHLGSRSSLTFIVVTTRGLQLVGEASILRMEYGSRTCDESAFRWRLDCAYRACVSALSLYMGFP